MVSLLIVIVTCVYMHINIHTHVYTCLCTLWSPFSIISMWMCPRLIRTLVVEASIEGACPWRKQIISQHHWLPITLHLPVWPGGTAFVHFGMSTGVIIYESLIQATIFLNYNECRFAVTPRRHYLGPLALTMFLPSLQQWSLSRKYRSCIVDALVRVGHFAILCSLHSIHSGSL